MQSVKKRNKFFVENLERLLERLITFFLKIEISFKSNKLFFHAYFIMDFKKGTNVTSFQFKRQLLTNVGINIGNNTTLVKNFNRSIAPLVVIVIHIFTTVINSRKNHYIQCCEIKKSVINVMRYFLHFHLT